MQSYGPVIASTSTNVITPSNDELLQGNDPLTPYASNKNNGYYRQMSQGVSNVSTEVVNAIIAAGLTPGAGLTQLAQALAIFGNPVGSIITKASTSVPTGYLECDGSAISRTTYANLFADIGTTWGVGDGSTTFNIPDLRGYFQRGWSHGSSVDSGRVFASAQTDAFQGHLHLQNHPNNGASSKGVGTPGGPSVSGIYMGSGNIATTAPQILTDAAYTDGTNGTPRTATETRPVNKSIMYCIKY